MNDDFLLDAALLNQAVFGASFAAVARAELDLATVASWDPTLSRNRRILVPVDVQALQVPTAEAEPLVRVTGRPDDPAPFDGGKAGEAGIHLHWAMPDALLRSADAEPDGALTLPALPDRWVVVRLLFPEGADRPHVRGWVIDARLGAVTGLDGFDGTPVDDDSLPTFDHLDGAVGGSLTWTASYHASRGRFGFHDPLDDLEELQTKIAPDGFYSDTATYVVCGWMSQSDQDPLSGVTASALCDVLAELGWSVDHEVDDGIHEPDNPYVERLENVAATSMPAEGPAVEVVAPDGIDRFSEVDVSPLSALPVDIVDRVLIAPQGIRYSSLFHGLITGVPIHGDPTDIDDRPDAADLGVAIGLDTDDVIAALGGKTLDLEDRESSERLAAAFTSDLLERLRQPDGFRDVAEREHADTFWSLVGPPLPEAEPDRLRPEDGATASGTTLGRKGRPLASKADPVIDLNPTVAWSDKLSFDKPVFERAPLLPSAFIAEPASTRVVDRPAPRIFRPQAPMIAVQGARPTLRHHYDGIDDDDGRLRCRYPGEVVTCIQGVVEASELIETLGSGAIPGEVLTIVREAVLLSPYTTRWLAEAASTGSTDLGLATARIQAESLRLFSPDGRYDGTGEFTISTAPRTTRARRARAVAGDTWASVSVADEILCRQISAQLAEFSLLCGTAPSPVAVTTWRQPWVPLFIEWQVELTGSTTLEGWELDDLDLAPTSTNTSDVAFTFSGRSTVGRGLAQAMHGGIQRWLDEEQNREATQQQLSEDQQAELTRLSEFLAPLDLVSASLDGIREQLLGINFVGGLVSAPGDDDRPVADRLPTPLFGGTIRLAELRMVDAFGRTLNVPLAELTKPLYLEVDGAASSIRVPPRLQHGARWLFRFVDPAHSGTAETARHAFVNQVRPDLAVNPIAGFLLPDHIDEALEVFDQAGAPLGQLSHHEITGNVRWEPAPGRPVAPGSGPLAQGPQEGLFPRARHVGEFAAGVVRADVVNRNGEAPDPDSSLTALLRAIDTTLWTVDTFASLGTPSVAGLIGRPIAVVRATLRLDLPDDIDEVIIAEASGVEGRAAAFAALNDIAFPVRLGDLHRSDDALLGFFVNDDYNNFHLIHRDVGTTALDVGRHRGQLGLLGQVKVPDAIGTDHPYVMGDDILHLRPGQVVSLTLLMLPAGAVNLTSGVLPRKQLRLADDWVTPGLCKLVPSVRVGPVLVDPEEIRLPKVNLLGERQQFTRRTGPITWRDDPIVAATQSALLPRMPHEIQEGWIRVMNQEGGDGDE